MQSQENGPRAWRDLVFSDLGILLLLALARLVLHALTNGQYGFHRDELAMLNDGRHLAWGYIAYPPLTPFVTWVGLALFGPSMVGLRLFSGLAQGAAMVLAGLIARELGGKRLAQVVAALAVAIAPISVVQGTVISYVTFDYLWWVLTAYFVLRLLKTEDERGWLAIGAAAGLGLMTKYTMAFYLAGIGAGFVLTRARRHLASRWLWGGVAVAALMCAPNVIWQLQHGLISLRFLASIHARDVAWGRTSGFLVDQLFVPASPVTIPLWVAGLYFYLIAPAGRRYRALGWAFAVTFALFFVAQGRDYYLAPAYPALLAAGAVAGEAWLDARSPGRARAARTGLWVALAGGMAFATVALPIAPVNSGWWKFANQVDEMFREEIGWPELVQTVADVYAGLPAEERAQTGILAGNYGEAGALDLYGPAHGLPTVICGGDSYWLRGYGDPPPRTLIVVGYRREDLTPNCGRVDLAGHVTNVYGVKNEESTQHPDIFVCRDLRVDWAQLWPQMLSFQ